MQTNSRKHFVCATLFAGVLTMDLSKKAIGNEFYDELLKHLESGKEMGIRQIYSLFPEIAENTLRWRLHKLVKLGKLQRGGQGQYLLYKIAANSAAGYSSIQELSKKVYNIVIDFGYNFYLTGLDSLIGDVLHVPEKYPVLIVIDDPGIIDLQNALSENGLLVFTEKDRGIIGKSTVRDIIDVFILRGKSFDFSKDHIARKEKGFIDLYYAVTRLEYGVSVQELSRIYQSLIRNQSLAPLIMKRAAIDRGIHTEINWLTDLRRTPAKAREFMMYQDREI